MVSVGIYILFPALTKNISCAEFPYYFPNSYITQREPKGSFSPGKRVILDKEAVARQSRYRAGESKAREAATRKQKGQGPGI